MLLEGMPLQTHSIVRSMNGKTIVFTLLGNLVMVLNHKIAQWYEKNMELAKLYDKYYHAAACYAEDNLKGAKLQYYYRVTD